MRVTRLSHLIGVLLLFFILTKGCYMPDYIKATTGQYHAIKEIEIGDWDMDTDISKDIVHGLDANKIRRLSVVIRNDNKTAFFHNEWHSPNLIEVDLSINRIFPTMLRFIRRDGGIFNSASFSTTPFNRGWITIEYDAS